MKLGNLLCFGILSIFIEIHSANATWAPGKEPAHLNRNSPGVVNVVEQPGGGEKIWYIDDGRTGVQIFDRKGNLVDEILEFHTNNEVTKIDHQTGEKVRVSQISPSFRNPGSKPVEEAPESDQFRRFTKSSIFEGYQAYSKNRGAKSQNPCPADMKEELRKACLTFAANNSSYGLSSDPDPSIDPREKCRPGVSAFPKDPFYEASCMGTWLGLQGDKCRMSGLPASHGKLAFLVCRATLAARESHKCKEALPLVQKDMGGNLQISAEHDEKEAISMHASEVGEFFLGVCAGLTKVYAAEKSADCFSTPKVASDQVIDLDASAGKISQELGRKENLRNSVNAKVPVASPTRDR
jgi:hypothetical protein